jgi:hypothetical protein
VNALSVLATVATCLLQVSESCAFQPRIAKPSGHSHAGKALVLQADGLEVTAPARARERARIGPSGAFVARQHILTKDEKVFGYELLFRDGVENYFSAPDAEVASRAARWTALCLWDSTCSAMAVAHSSTVRAICCSRTTSPFCPQAIPWPKFWKVLRPTIWSWLPASGLISNPRIRPPHPRPSA